MAKEQISATVDTDVTADIKTLATKVDRSFSQMVEIAMKDYRNRNLPEEERVGYVRNNKSKSKK